MQDFLDLYEQALGSTYLCSEILPRTKMTFLSRPLKWMAYSQYTVWFDPGQRIIKILMNTTSNLGGKEDIFQGSCTISEVDVEQMVSDVLALEKSHFIRVPDKPDSSTLESNTSLVWMYICREEIEQLNRVFDNVMLFLKHVDQNASWYTDILFDYHVLQRVISYLI